MDLRISCHACLHTLTDGRKRCAWLTDLAIAVWFPYATYVFGIECVL
ncbi:hypothetical protein BIFDEN_02392 [Bifidobacterium dentium ATCC 27678]|nr:hypothetical protein BIFDEN_02392 [Bifidobacterium dentium ATCC 27678]